jgi:uncharacterized cupin superfamily protein
MDAFTPPPAVSGYDTWLEHEGLPVITGHGVEDAVAVRREPWPRLGGKGAYLKFQGLEGMTGLYVAEIPGGGMLEPEKHLYEELIYVLKGIGSTEVWRDERHKQRFEWSEGSLFAVPINTCHRLINGSREPAVVLGCTNAPMVFDIFHNIDFVLNCDYGFTDRYEGQEDYFTSEGMRYRKGRSAAANVWETNFIPDARMAFLEDSGDTKVVGGHRSVLFEMAHDILIGHITDWPVGRYHRAHYHPAGAALAILRSKGYSIMWPKEYGIRPYESGHGGDVVRVDWKVNGVFTPPSDWFHQHFNTGNEPARQLAFHYSSLLHRLEFRDGGPEKERAYLIPLREGGTLIEAQDEDPAIRQQYEEELRREGIPCTLPAA